MAAGQQQLNIVITAVDKATQKILAVNNAMNKMLLPMTRVNRSMQQFGKALTQNPAIQAFGKIGKAATAAGKEIYSLTRRTAEFVGIGSIAALAAVASEWGRLGFEIQRTSLIMGTTMQRVAQFRAIGTAGGIGPDAAVESYHSLGSAIENARFGRNPAAVGMLNQLGMGDLLNRNKPIDVNKTMLRLARVFGPGSKMNAQAKEFAAGVLGVTSMLPVLERGEQYMQHLQDVTAKSGFTDPTAIERAGKFGEALAVAKVHAQGLGSVIMSGLQPAMQPLLENFDRWEEDNKDIISSDVKGFVTGLLGPLKALAGMIDSLVKHTFGWHKTLQGLGFLLGVGLLAPVIKLVGVFGKLIFSVFSPGVAIVRLLSGAFIAFAPEILAVAAALAALYGIGELVSRLFTGKSLWSHIAGDGSTPDAAGPMRQASGSADAQGRQQFIADRMKSAGYSDAQIGGAMQGLTDESFSFDPNATNEGHVGIAQWDKHRQRLFQSIYGHPMAGHLDEQTDFMLRELANSERFAGDDLRRQDTIMGAYDSFRSNFERAPGTHRHQVEVHVRVIHNGLHFRVHGADRVHGAGQVTLPAMGGG